MQVKCTESDFRFFVKECKKYAKLLGLTDWSFYYEQVDMESYGNCLLDGRDRTVTIGFCKEWGKTELHPKTRENIRYTALHEVLHAAIYNLEYLSELRYVGKSEIDDAAEALVIRLTNFYFEKKKGWSHER